MKFIKRVGSLVLAVGIAVSCLTISAFAAGSVKKGVAFVDASALRLRSAPNTSSETLDLASRNEVVVITDKVDNWYKVIYNLQEGYMHSDYLDLISRENVELGYGVINAYCVNLRSGPSTSHSIVAQAYEGAKAYIIGINSGWYKVIYKNAMAYVRSDLLDLTEIPYENEDSKNEPLFFTGGKTFAYPSVSALNNPGSPAISGTASAVPENNIGSGSSQSGNTATTPEVSVPSTSGQMMVDVAKQYIGVRYVWGGSSPNGFDCSGLVQYVARQCGFSIARTANRQYNYGTYVEKANLQPGDLVFFANTYTSGISHVGIYIGDGDFIHAPNSGSNVKISSLNSGYYSSHYYGARRLG